MAHFRGTIQGMRGEASRLAGKDGMLSLQANGWHFGVTIELFNENEEDKVRITLTGGSGKHSAYRDKVLGTFTAKDLTR